MGLDVVGKELFGYIGEFSQALIAEKLLGVKAESPLSITLLSGDFSAYSISFLVRSSTKTCLGLAKAGIITYFWPALSAE